MQSMQAISSCQAPWHSAPPLTKPPRLVCLRRRRPLVEQRIKRLQHLPQLCGNRALKLLSADPQLGAKLADFASFGVEFGARIPERVFAFAKAVRAASLERMALGVSGNVIRDPMRGATPQGLRPEDAGIYILNTPRKYTRGRHPPEGNAVVAAARSAARCDAPWSFTVQIIKPPTSQLPSTRASLIVGSIKPHHPSPPATQAAVLMQSRSPCMRCLMHADAIWLRLYTRTIRAIAHHSHGAGGASPYALVGGHDGTSHLAHVCTFGEHLSGGAEIHSPSMSASPATEPLTVSK